MTKFTAIELPKTYKPKSIEQQKKERAEQRANERAAMIKKVPVGVRRAIERNAYWNRVEQLGLLTHGGYGSRRDEKDGRQYFDFIRSASREKMEIVRRLEREAKIKFSYWQVTNGRLTNDEPDGCQLSGERCE